MNKAEREKIEKMKNNFLLFKQQGKHWEAFKVLAELEKIVWLNREEMHMELLYRWLLHEHGGLLQNEGKFDQAISQLVVAVMYARAIKDKFGEATGFFQLGTCKKISGYYSSEDFWPDFEQAKKIYEGIYDGYSKKDGKMQVVPEGKVAREEFGILLHNLAYIDQIKGNAQKAFEKYEEAMPYREGRDLAMTKARIAECYLALVGKDHCDSNFSKGKKLALAKKNAVEAMEFFVTISDKNRIRQIQETLEKINEEEKKITEKKRGEKNDRIRKK